ncbi:MAG TPA: HAMP domain-containing sensor histidine kinase [Fluviicola sp.]|nr:HAMP domain-containing sensor histidine kinase [Fluviicola sp.]
MRRKPTSVFVYLLGAYVVVQFIWWGYHLIDLTRTSEMADSQVTKRVFMIIGEGSVFLLLLLFGLYKIKTSINKEINMARQQQNFMLSVTHELKTPIAANKLYLQTLLKRSLSDEKRAEMIQKAIDETNRLELLVEQILTASRLEQEKMALQKEPVDLELFFTELIAVQQKRFDTPIHLDLEKTGRLVTDKLVFATICNNLIENAWKYGATEKGIQVTVRGTESHCVILVRDFGKGIPAGQEKAIFRKFIRLENEETRSTKGTGLGLYIAYQFTKALNGKLLLLKTDGPGACFEISIPYE